MRNTSIIVFLSWIFGAVFCSGCTALKSSKDYCTELIVQISKDSESTLTGSPTEKSEKAGKDLEKSYQQCRPTLEEFAYKGSETERILAIDYIAYSGSDEGRFEIFKTVLSSLSGKDSELGILSAVAMALRKGQNLPKSESAVELLKQLIPGKDYWNKLVFRAIADLDPERAMKFVQSILDDPNSGKLSNQWPLQSFLKTLANSSHEKSRKYAEALLDKTKN